MSCTWALNSCPRSSESRPSRSPAADSRSHAPKHPPSLPRRAPPGDRWSTWSESRSSRPPWEHRRARQSKRTWRLWCARSAAPGRQPKSLWGSVPESRWDWVRLRSGLSLWTAAAWDACSPPQRSKQPKVGSLGLFPQTFEERLCCAKLPIEYLISYQTEHHRKAEVSALFPGCRWFLTLLGCDVGGCFFILNQLITTKVYYDYIYKIHTKTVPSWRSILCFPLSGSPSIVQKCLEILETRPDVGAIENQCWSLISVWSGIWIHPLLH